MIRIDPASGAQVARVPVGNGPAGFAFDGSFIWILNHRENTLDRIDPMTNQVVRMATIPGGERVAAERIAVFDGLLWITGRGLDLLRVSPATGSVVGSTEIGTGGIDVVTDGSEPVGRHLSPRRRCAWRAAGGIGAAHRRGRWNRSDRLPDSGASRHRGRGCERAALAVRRGRRARRAASGLRRLPSNNLDPMSRAVVLSAVRTPVGRYGGALAGERPDDLAALVIKEAVERAGMDANEIEDVYFGATNQAGEDNRNVARMAALLAGLPESVAGVTVNRLCASGLSAVVIAARMIDGRRRRCVRRGRRRVDEPCTARAWPRRKPLRPRGNQRSATRRSAGACQSAHGGAASPLVDGRDRRERRRASTRSVAQDQDTFALQIAAALADGRRRGPLRRRARPGRGFERKGDRASSGTRPEAGHDAGEARQPQARILARAAR